jgi:hypothetical protein
MPPPFCFGTEANPTQFPAPFGLAPQRVVACGTLVVFAPANVRHAKKVE